MKKKSKILNKLFTVFVAVLCMAMLCVPAMASAPVEGDLIEILPETDVIFDSGGEGLVSESVLFSAGNTYVVNFNGQEYVCVAQDLSAMASGVSLVGNGSNMGLSGNNEPFVFISGDIPDLGIFTMCVADDVYRDRTIPISIYQVVESSSNALFSDISTLVDSSIGWIGQFVEVVTSNALLLCFCVVMFVGLGIGLIARIKR